MRIALLAVSGVLAIVQGSWAATLSLPLIVGPADAPGPSAALFANPPYQCVRNVYVAPTGSDSAAGTLGAPWNTLQKADATASAGTCVNVAPGTYAAGVTITHGGNAATPTGYVVYRCQNLDACKITSTGGNGSPTFTIISSNSVNYVMIDGFDMAAASQAAYGAAVYINNNNAGAPTGTLSAHHVWILNSLMHGYGEAGVATNEADYIYVIHNSAYNNAGVTCDAQGSGIGLVVAKGLSNYTATTMDKKYGPFNQIVAWNIAHDNMIITCGNAVSAYNTDGNGIIIDTFNGSGVDNVLYTKQTLVSNNLIYNNGGKGIQVFRSSYVTVSNNTAYNNNLDPWDKGFPRGEINNAGGFNNSYYANIAWATPAASTADARCQGATYDIAPAPCPLMANVAFLGGDSAGVTDANNVWLNNISFGGAPPWGWGPSGNAILNGDTVAFSCSANQCNVSPLLVNAAGGNFALQSSSPAINYGLPQTWLPASAIDAGACHRSRTTCP